MKRFKISNRIIVPFFVTAAVITFVQAVMGMKVSDYIFGMTVSFVFMFVLYCFKGIGAADVKIAAVHGLLMGLCGIKVILVSAFMAGTAVGLIEIVFKKCVVRHVAGIPFKVHAIHFGAAILFGVVIFVFKVLIEGGICI